MEGVHVPLEAGARRPGDQGTCRGERGGADPAVAEVPTGRAEGRHRRGAGLGARAQGRQLQGPDRRQGRGALRAARGRHRGQRHSPKEEGTPREGAGAPGADQEAEGLARGRVRQGARPHRGCPEADAAGRAGEGRRGPRQGGAGEEGEGGRGRGEPAAGRGGGRGPGPARLRGRGREQPAARGHGGRGAGGGTGRALPVGAQLGFPPRREDPREEAAAVAGEEG
mmetsp:Transcript_988/g.3011  ORF Transcript_988/g.3011 Transcript_988/m.3011 type:complete len:225 (+) Transcript_988:1720-2394(+)